MHVLLSLVFKTRSHRPRRTSADDSSDILLQQRSAKFCRKTQKEPAAFKQNPVAGPLGEHYQIGPKKKELCLVSDQVSKSGVVMQGDCRLFFGGFADILGQMEQCTAIHTKSVLD